MAKKTNRNAKKAAATTIAEATLEQLVAALAEFVDAKAVKHISFIIEKAAEGELEVDIPSMIGGNEEDDDDIEIVEEPKSKKGKKGGKKSKKVEEADEEEDDDTMFDDDDLLTGDDDDAEEEGEEADADEDAEEEEEEEGDLAAALEGLGLKDLKALGAALEIEAKKKADIIEAILEEDEEDVYGAAEELEIELEAGDDEDEEEEEEKPAKKSTKKPAAKKTEKAPAKKAGKKVKIPNVTAADKKGFDPAAYKSAKQAVAEVQEYYGVKIPVPGAVAKAIEAEALYAKLEANFELDELVAMMDSNEVEYDFKGKRSDAKKKEAAICAIVAHHMVG